MESFFESAYTMIKFILKPGIKIKAAAGEEFKEFGLETLDSILKTAAQPHPNLSTTATPDFIIKCVHPSTRTFKIIFASSPGQMALIAELLSSNEYVESAVSGDEAMDYWQFPQPSTGLSLD